MWCTEIICSPSFRPVVESFSWMKFCGLVNPFHPEKNGCIEIRFSQLSFIHQIITISPQCTFVCPKKAFKDIFIPTRWPWDIKKINILHNGACFLTCYGWFIICYVHFMITWHMALSLSTVSISRIAYTIIWERIKVTFKLSL